jgi:hypothetical protein
VSACTTIQDELLEAAPDELAGVARTPIAEHLRDCPDCAPVARLLLDEHARLGRALALVQPSLSPDEATDDVLTTARLAPDSTWRDRVDRARRFLITALPMAAAAAIAAYFVYGLPGRDVPAVDVTVPAPEVPARFVRATVPAGASAVVLRTANPNITLVWITEKEITP